MDAGIATVALFALGYYKTLDDVGICDATMESQAVLAAIVMTKTLT